MVVLTLPDSKTRRGTASCFPLGSSINTSINYNSNRNGNKYQVAFNLYRIALALAISPAENPTNDPVFEKVNLVDISVPKIGSVDAISKEAFDIFKSEISVVGGLPMPPIAYYLDELLKQKEYYKALNEKTPKYRRICRRVALVHQYILFKNQQDAFITGGAGFATAAPTLGLRPGTVVSQHRGRRSAAPTAAFPLNTGARQTLAPISASVAHMSRRGRTAGFDVDPASPATVSPSSIGLTLGQIQPSVSASDDDVSSTEFLRELVLPKIHAYVNADGTLNELGEDTLVTWAELLDDEDDLEGGARGRRRPRSRRPAKK